MAEQVFPAAPISTGAGRIIASPFQFVTSGEDNLRIACANSLTNVRLAIQGRRLTERGTVEPFAFTFTPTTDRTVTTQNFPLGVGAILNMTIFATGATPQIGQTFVQAKLIRGFSGAMIVLGTLLQGYVTSSQELAWPGSPIVSSRDGGGYLRTITGTQPAAGSELLETVPANARWRLLAFRARLNASAAAGTRQAQLYTDDGTSAVVISGNPATIAPSGTATHFWTVGMPLTVIVSPSANLAGLSIEPDLLAGWHIGTITSSIAAGDQWLAPIYVVSESLEVL